MQIKIKLLNDLAKEPTYANFGDAGADIYATEVIETPTYVEYKTGLALDIPLGYVGKLYPRSSISKTGCSLANCVGIVDSPFDQEISFRFYRHEGFGLPYKVGDRIGQLIVEPVIRLTFVKVTDFGDKKTRAGGYGSSGV